MRTEILINNFLTPKIQLPYPSIPSRVKECAFGSERREALGALHTASADQWSYTSEPTTQIQVRDKLGREVHFQYDHERKLITVHLQSKSGAIDLDGNCGLAQSIARFARRAAGALLQRESLTCLTQLMHFVNGSLTVSSTYESKSDRQHISKGGFEHNTNERATIQLLSGSLKIHYNYCHYRQPLHERQVTNERELHDHIERQMAKEAIMRSRSFSPFPQGTSFGYDHELALLSIPRVEPSEGENETYKATLVNPKLDSIADIFKIESLDHKFQRARLSFWDNSNRSVIYREALKRASESAAN